MEINHYDLEEVKAAYPVGMRIRHFLWNGHVVGYTQRSEGAPWLIVFEREGNPDAKQIEVMVCEITEPFDY